MYFRLPLCERWTYRQITTDRLVGGGGLMEPLDHIYHLYSFYFQDVMSIYFRTPPQPFAQIPVLEQMP